MAASLRIRPACRVVIDNDWAGDPDGLVALAHHLLSPSNDVRVVTSSSLNPVFGPPEGTAARGAALASELIGLLDASVEGGVHAGPDTTFTGEARTNPAADAIIAEALRDDPLQLYLVCAGPLTNVADALLARPDLVDALVIVWVGGTRDAGGWEYNRATDEDAAAYVLGTTARIIQYPLESYRVARIGVAELEQELAGSGAVGGWLWERFVTLPLPDEVALGEVWALGDSLPLLVTALGRASFEESDLTAGVREVGPDDVRLLIGDLLAKLRLAERRRDV
ncbi:nucleoside hydrolase [Microbacterium sp. NPDC019599]|uniref:nucleoside hydrolase n=1 Tax=Microbacterium sp. NPDC019599 TaxID=3154690 RepID=UPI0033E61F6A